jgi:hypothetical protein
MIGAVNVLVVSYKLSLFHLINRSLICRKPNFFFDGLPELLYLHS